MTSSYKNSRVSNLIKLSYLYYLFLFCYNLRRFINLYYIATMEISEPKLYIGSRTSYYFSKYNINWINSRLYKILIFLIILGNKFKSFFKWKFIQGFNRKFSSTNSYVRQRFKFRNCTKRQIFFNCEGQSCISW